MSLLIESPDVNWADNRMIARIRLILASSALLIISLDPPKPARHATAVYTALILYTVYSAALHLLVTARKKVIANINRWGHWPDVGWYALLIALNDGANSLFFYGFFFAILVSSFRLGFWGGYSVTTISALSFIAISLLMHPGESEFEINRMLLRIFSFLIIGYLIAYWGESEVTNRRRLGLLRDVNRISNPRFGIDRTVGAVIERLQAFYNADACLLIMAELENSTFTMRRAVRNAPETARHVELIAPRLGQRFLELPSTLAAIYRGHSRWRRVRRAYHGYDCVTSRSTAEGRETAAALAAMLDAESFVTVPAQLNRSANGRLFISGKGPFTHLDVVFLLQVIEQILPVIDNIRLVDRLASDAAEEERQRIARDIHDSVVQPYIGLQIGLDAVRQKLPLGDQAIANEIERLSTLTEVGIAELRHYISSLKDNAQHGERLLGAVQRFAARFGAATGISVEVKAETEIEVNDRLSAEIFQMIIEGLSNIRRHTHVARAMVSLSCHSERFILRIENESDDETIAPFFTPRSITERASALGGQAQVERGADGRTIVRVEIPL